VRRFNEIFGLMRQKQIKKSKLDIEEEARLYLYLIDSDFSIEAGLNIMMTVMFRTSLVIYKNTPFMG
jgi:hypothetical protein